MDLNLLSAYLPRDRRCALATGRPLPDRAEGAVLLADLAGFTPLADALSATLGPRRGVEELTRLLNGVYEILIAQVHHHGGSVVSFVGDGLVCWFDDDLGHSHGEAAHRAVACGLAMQRVLASFTALPAPDAQGIPVSMQAGVAAGPVRRFEVGDARVQRLDLLAGATLDRMALAEHLAQPGEVVLGPEAARQLGHRLRFKAWRQGFGVVESLAAQDTPDPAVPWPKPSEERMQPYLLPPIYQRLAAGQGEFLAELRPAAALFLRFEGLDYERDDAASRLDAFVRWVQAVLTRYAGHLLQLTAGDKGSFFYAAFGVPVAHEDDAARAVEAALTLRRPPPELDFISGVQIGLSRGRVRAGAYGSRTRRTYGAIGPEAIVACRLMEVAPPGEVWCSPAIYKAAGARWTFEPLAPVTLKGRPAPLAIYRPLGRAQERADRNAEILLGRKTEMVVLARALAQAQSGQRRVLLLEGEAGIGKSRLLAELKRHAQRQDMTWLEGAGQSIEQRTPYRAWRDVLAGYLDLEPHMSQAERQRRVRERVSGVNPALAPRVPLLNDILRLDLPETDLTRGFAPRLRQESLTALVVDLLRAAFGPSTELRTGPSTELRTGPSTELRTGPSTGLRTGPSTGLRTDPSTGLRMPLTGVETLREPGQGRPLVLVLEDSHWLDASSWKLALAVARGLATDPAPPQSGLLLVLALRPLEEPIPAEYTGLAELEETEILHLDALAPQEALTLAAARLGVAPETLPAEVAALIQAHAGGNPFFAEELVYMLHDSGMLQVQDGTCALTDSLDALREQVPETVEGVVLARIDRLPPEQQLLLKVAAVIGRSFLYRTLCDVHPHQVVQTLLQAYLDDLAWRGLTPLERLEPELSYLFKHVIIQQVAYDTLLFTQRRELHQAVAGWYERVYGEHLSPYYALLAHHYHHAEDRARERHYARLAGEQAAAQYANAEAVAYFSRALALTLAGDAAEQDAGRLEERYALLLAREKVYYLQGERQAQAQDLAELERLAAVLAGEGQRIEVTLRQARYAHVTGDYPATIQAVQTAIHLAHSAQNASDEARGYLEWARALHRQGDGEAARQRLEQALALSQRAGSRTLEADSLHLLGIVCYGQGDYGEARNYYEQALHLFCETGDRRGESNALNNLGRVFAEQSDFAKARVYYEQALGICREIGDRLGEVGALNGLAIVFSERGDYAAANTHFEQVLRISREIGNRLYESSALSNLGETFCRLGDYAAGMAYYEQALPVHREIGYRLGEGSTLLNQGMVSHHRGDEQAALAYLQQGLRMIQELGDRHFQGYAWNRLGLVQMGLGQPVEAAAAYHQALNLRRALGQHHLALESLAGLAQVSETQGDLWQALTHVEEILGHLETHSLNGTDEPFRVYLTCYRVLQANADPRAREVLRTAYSLLQERAAKITDEALRRSFLENVAVHRAIVAAYRAAQIAG